MKVLSLFDGISGGQLALKRAGVSYSEYFASEIEKPAIKITQKHFPGTVQLGDVKKIKEEDLPKIDLLIGGSPCQSLSGLNKITTKEKNGLAQGHSILFWQYVRLLKELKPEYFFLENVASMTKTEMNLMTSVLRVKPIKVNSALVSGQNRNRLYWTNLPKIDKIEDKGIRLKDVIQKGYTEREKSCCCRAQYNGKNTSLADYFYIQIEQIIFNKPVKRGKIEYGRTRDKEVVYFIDGKTFVFNFPNGKIVDRRQFDGISVYTRKLTPIEYERLQTLPDDYTEGISNNQRYRAVGNGWTVDVIKDFFKELK